MKVRYAAITDRGRKRKINEDYYHAEYPVFVVADGLGGHRGGEIASKLAVNSFVDYLKHSYKSARSVNELAKIMEKSILEIGKKLLKESSKNEELEGMGTTISAAVFYKDYLTIAHVGDSRVYLLRKGNLKQITKDHTFVQMLVDRGEITAEEAKEHPLKNALLQAVGTDALFEVEIKTLKLIPSDALLLCTDGLHSHLTETQIIEVLKSELSTEDKVKRLVRQALDAGGNDNITAILLEIEKDEI